MKTFERSLLAISFISAFIGIIHLIPQIISLILGLSILIYLILGWKILLPEKSDANSYILPFIISYLTSQTFATIIFGINDWPMKNMFSYFTLVVLILCIVVIIVLRPKLKEEYPLNSYILRLVICSMFAGSPLWM